MKKLLLLAFVALFLFPVGASHPSASLVDITGTVHCTSSDVTHDGYTRCIVDNGTLGSMIGVVDVGTHVHINEKIIDGIRTPSENTILVLRNVVITADDIFLNFSGFDSIVLENTTVTITQRGIGVYPTRFFNASNSHLAIDRSPKIHSTYVNFQNVQIETFDSSRSVSVDIVAPFINASSDTVVTGRGIYLFDGISSQPVPATLGKISFLGRLNATIIRIRGDNSDVYLRNVNGSTIQIIGKDVFLGSGLSSSSTGGSIGHGGAGATNVTIVATRDFRQYRYWPIYGKTISIYSGGYMEIKDDIDAFSNTVASDSTDVYPPTARCGSWCIFAGAPLRVKGNIVLAGAGSLTIEQAADLTAENWVSSTSDLFSTVPQPNLPSILLSFPNGNMLIKGRLSTYNSPSSGTPGFPPAPYQPRLNAIEINAGNLVVQDSTLFRIQSAGLVTIRAPSLTIPNSVVTALPDHIRGDLSGSFAVGEMPIKIFSCSPSGIPPLFRDTYWHDLNSVDSSACPNPRSLNVYGYLETPAGTPYSIGAAKVNWIHVAIPTEPPVLNSTRGNFVGIYPNIFANRDGFFSFSIPNVPLTAGVYRVGVTFSTNSSFNCTTGGACQDRVVIATALPG